MNKNICVLCKKPMGNSLSTFAPNSDYRTYVHTKCQKMFECRNCLSMIIRGVEGKCICGNIIQLKVDGERYRIMHEVKPNLSYD